MQEKRNAGGAGLVVGSAAAIMAAIALARDRVAKAAPGDNTAFNEALLEILSAMAETNGEILTAIQRFSFGNGDGGPENIIVQGFPPNTKTIMATRVQITALNTPIQLPQFIVPDDMELQIKGWPTNAGLIYVSDARANATNVNQVWPLLANEAIGYRIHDSEDIYISGTAIGDFAALTVEQRR